MSHYGDDILWVEKVINSCTEYKHTITANKILYLLEARLKRDNIPSRLVIEIYWELKNKISHKRLSILHSQHEDNFTQQ